MPWQTAPGLFIIIGAFTFIGSALPAVHWLVKGKTRIVGRDDWDFMMEQRDIRLLEAKKKASG